MIFSRRSIATLLFILCGLSLAAQQRNSFYDDYIARFGSVAIDQMNRYGIPASITMAQGLLESGAGRSELATKGNNHFGIKCHSWTGPTIYHDDDATGECFRAYGNARESYEDHSRFLVNSTRYRKLFQYGRKDYKSWAHGLKECGYATDPQYAYRLISLIERYDLHRLDDGVATAYSPAYEKKPTIVGAVAHSSLHEIEIFNKNYYLITREGDTFRSLSAETGISARKLAKHNELNIDSPLHAGQVVWLKKKQSRAPKEYKRRPNVVAAGQSLYDISQMYGIRLKSLYKLNRLQPDYVPKVGDIIFVR